MNKLPTDIHKKGFHDYSDEQLKFAVAACLNAEQPWMTTKMIELARNLRERMFRAESGTPIKKYTHPTELKLLKEIARRVQKDLKNK